MHVSGNAQLGRLVDLVKLLHSSVSSEMARTEQRKCEEHRQGVSLFCEDDQEPVCHLCAQGPAHQGHHVRPVEEVAHQYKQRLGGFIESLKTQRAMVEKLLVIQDRNLPPLREELSQFVEPEKEAALCRSPEDKRLQQQFRAKVALYSDRISMLKDLRREVAELSLMSEEMLLRGLRGLQQRSAGLQPRAVKLLPFRPVAYSLLPLCSALSSIMRRFRESISLDPDTAHPSLRMSKDKKFVTWDETAQLVVLGREGFASGRHYWEVQVGAKPEWAVGMCSVAPSAQVSRPLAAPKRCWTLQLQEGDYLAMSMSAGAVPLALRDQPAAMAFTWTGSWASFPSTTPPTGLTCTHSPSPLLKSSAYFRLGPDCAPLSVGVGRV
ncbi:tripartite motif-containing protein 75-like [Sorex fumeus]|uniref:tripartite motif-containing protein 75-like n=1 Tax=Sorex fumeus TaxID=62283 RepID=UPI0024AC9C4A|nr:tripartite motif-containing protein 75-like [Sorex fumeus]